MAAQCRKFSNFFSFSFRCAYFSSNFNHTPSLQNLEVISAQIASSYNYAVIRHKSTTVKRRTTHWPRWQLRRKVKHIVPDITPDNKEFIQEFIEDKYLQPGESPLKEEAWPRPIWTPESQRCGLIARKIGSYPMWSSDGKKVFTTLLQVLDNHVIRYNPPELVDTAINAYQHKFPKGKYGSLVVGVDAADPQLFTKEYCNLFKEAGVMPKRKLTRFYITPDAAIKPGTPLNINHFSAGQYVDVYGKTVGHGFQGVVKRWGFKGGPSDLLGCTKTHRRPGAIGGGDRGNIHKGKKMPGHMGQERRTHAGVKIWRINTKYNVIWVNGNAIPGHVHSYVYIMDSRVKEKTFTADNPPPFPTLFPEDIKEEFPEETYDKDLHLFDNETVTFKQEEEMKKGLKIKKKS